jgi:hypothetical protein
MKGFNEAKCQIVDKAMLDEFDNCFPLDFEAIPNVELFIQCSIEAPSWI